MEKTEKTGLGESPGEGEMTKGVIGTELVFDSLRELLGQAVG